ncbi:MAG TPA: hypothetical protein VFY68_05375, partial [Nitrososphaeraceae archaeon]|nr:hypothetical protein [Nitrososphaeraceae archaeon]
SCTIDPGYDDKRFSGIEIERQLGEQQNTDPTITTDNIDDDNNNRYTNQKKSDTSPKEISFIKSISGGIIVDDSVSTINLEDSIVDNLGGHAIYLKENEKREKNPILKLEVMRSNILSDYQDPYVLELKDICCTNSILTNRVNVKINEKQDGTDDNVTGCSSVKHSRYEEGSTFKNTGKDNTAIVDCTTERPIFISTTFGHPAYLHLDHLNSKSILEGAENTLEMGAFNKNFKPVRMRNLNLKLREFLPLGIKSGVINTY